MSPFEVAQLAHKSGRKGARPRETERILISNSLSVRRHWIETFGGRGVIPSPMRKSQSGRGRDAAVYLVAQDAFSPRLWEKIAAWV
jgi:hypothetical protein